MLDLLREETSLTAGEIAAHFLTISRPAVSKHLRVLRRSGLVLRRDRGREVHYRLDSRPLAGQREWLERFAPVMEASLAELKRRVEDGS